MPAVTTANDMYEVLAGADALVICTEWSEFRHPDFDRVAAALRAKVIFDGRNIYRPSLMQKLGFIYYSVGREPVGGGQGRGVRSQRPGVRTSSPI